MRILRRTDPWEFTQEGFRSVDVTHSFKSGWSVQYIDEEQDVCFLVEDEIEDLDDAIQQATQWAAANGRTVIIVDDFPKVERSKLSPAEQLERTRVANANLKASDETALARRHAELAWARGDYRGVVAALAPVEASRFFSANDRERLTNARRLAGH